jgi:hypothetical protein
MTSLSAQRMRARLGSLVHRGRGRLRRRPNEHAELIERLDRLLYLAENERRAIDEGLAAVLERLRLLEARCAAAESVREGSATNR